MKHAFEKAGLSPRDNEFLIAIAKYLNSGGTIDRCHALVDQAAAKMGKVGHADHAPSQTALADFPHHTPSEGHSSVAQQGQRDHANARSPLPEGHEAFAKQGQRDHADGQPIASGKAIIHTPIKASQPAPPAREPDRKFIEARARDRHQTNAIWLSRTKTSDGRYWSAVHPREFVGMRRDGKIAAVIEQVYGPFNAKQMNMPLSDLLTPAMEAKIVRILERKDAA